MREPFFTIITATYNAADTLPRLLDSLAGQTSRDFELIIQDGASTDDTVAIAESYRGKLPALSLASEQDSGIYDAWNKALSRVRGEWVLFLGADDALIDKSSLSEASIAIHKQPEDVFFVAADVVLCDQGAELVTVRAKTQCLGEKIQFENPVIYSGLFQRRIILTGEPYDTTLKFLGDFDFLVRNWKQGRKFANLGFVVVSMNIGGATNSLRYLSRCRFEEARVIGRYFGWKKTIPRLTGIIKGFFPFVLVNIFGEKRALTIYNWLRSVRRLPPALIK